MLLIVAGRTAPNRAVRFGGEHDALDDRGRRAVAALAAEAASSGALPSGSLPSGWCSGPEVSVRQSAELLLAHWSGGRRPSASSSPGRPSVPERSGWAGTGDGAPLAFVSDPGLASLDVGSWRGRAPEEIPGAELGAWFADPAARPHGGESVAGFVGRIRRHVETLPGDAVLIVAKPVAQALLCTGAAGFFAADVRPASIHRC